LRRWPTSAPRRRCPRWRRNRALKLYLAGPLFSAAEIDFNARLAALLRAAGHEVFLPQESEVQHGSAAAIFKSDVAGIDGAEIVVANMDGADPDSGTCWECGYAYGRGMPVVLFRTDFRKAGESDEAPYNLMLTEAATKVLNLPRAAMEQVGSALVAALDAVSPPLRRG
jgi:nucleoside 2-deoxyribosyltransferase